MTAAELSNYIMQQSMRQAERTEFVELSRTIVIDGVTMPMDEISRYIKNPPESYLRIMQNEIERLHQKICKPATTTDLVDEDSKYDYLYIADELISSRIQWEGVSRMEIKYYETSDVGVPWWKFWIDRCTLANEKNILLWREARAVYRVKKMPWQMRPLPPLKYRMM